MATERTHAAGPRAGHCRAAASAAVPGDDRLSRRHLRGRGRHHRLRRTRARTGSRGFRRFALTAVGIAVLMRRSAGPCRRCGTLLTRTRRRTALDAGDPARGPGRDSGGGGDPADAEPARSTSPMAAGLAPRRPGDHVCDRAPDRRRGDRRLRLRGSRPALARLQAMGTADQFEPVLPLFSLAGSHRYQYWQVAWKAFTSSPLHGIGPGTFQYYWNEHAGRYAEKILNAHSLWFETLAETGIVGWLLLAGFFALIAIGGAVRALRDTGPSRRTDRGQHGRRLRLLRGRVVRLGLADRRGSDGGAAARGSHTGSTAPARWAARGKQAAGVAGGSPLAATAPVARSGRGRGDDPDRDPAREHDRVPGEPERVQCRSPEAGAERREDRSGDRTGRRIAVPAAGARAGAGRRHLRGRDGDQTGDHPRAEQLPAVVDRRASLPPAQDHPRQALFDYRRMLALFPNYPALYG